MKILVQPQKGGTYKLLFYDGRHTRRAAFVEVMRLSTSNDPVATPVSVIVSVSVSPVRTLVITTATVSTVSE